MKISKKICIVLMVLLAAAVCQAAEHEMETTMVDDGTIAANVKAALQDNPGLAGMPIKVVVEDGEVTLLGSVDTSQAKNQAESVAMSVEGVKVVKNLLQLMSAP